MATAAALAQQSTPAFGGAATVPMSGLRKAAILVVALGDQMAKEIFQALSPTDVRQVVAEIAQLGEVPGHELAHVLAAFSDQLAADQYSLRGGADCANRLLVQAFGPDRAAQTLHEVNVAGSRSRADLSLLQRMEPQQISRFLENEHPQTIALVIAHLDGKKGSALLMHLDPALRVETVLRLAEMRQFSPEIAQKVGMMLHTRMQSVGPADRKSYAGFKAAADLLNRLDTPATKAILEANGNFVNGQTPSSFFASFLTQLGSQVAQAQQANTTQQASLTQLATQQSAQSSVSLDQEAANLSLYERSYDAAAKVFTIVDQLMAVALNLGEPSTVS